MRDFYASYIEDTLLTSPDYVSTELLSDDNSVAIRMMPATNDEYYIEGNVYNFTFQFFVRTKENKDCLKLASSIMDVLHLKETTLNTASPYKINFIKCFNPPSFQQRDEFGRDIMILSFESEIM